jgi:hypothetical protein
MPGGLPEREASPGKVAFRDANGSPSGLGRISPGESVFRRTGRDGREMGGDLHMPTICCGLSIASAGSSTGLLALPGMGYGPRERSQGRRGSDPKGGVHSANRPTEHTWVGSGPHLPMSMPGAPRAPPMFAPLGVGRANSGGGWVSERWGEILSISAEGLPRGRPRPSRMLCLGGIGGIGLSNDQCKGQ